MSLFLPNDPSLPPPSCLGFTSVFYVLSVVFQCIKISACPRYIITSLWPKQNNADGDPLYK